MGEFVRELKLDVMELKETDKGKTRKLTFSGDLSGIDVKVSLSGNEFVIGEFLTEHDLVRGSSLKFELSKVEED